MDYVPFASVIKFFFTKKLHLKNSGWYSIECVKKTEFRLKIMKFVEKLKNRLLVFASSKPPKGLPLNIKI